MNGAVLGAFRGLLVQHTRADSVGGAFPKNTPTLIPATLAESSRSFGPVALGGER